MAIEIDQSESAEDVADLARRLHCPERFNHLGDLEHHVGKSARLARALWEALGNYDALFDDVRSREAVIELACEVADHSSAVEFIFHRDAERKTRKNLAVLKVKE